LNWNSGWPKISPITGNEIFNTEINYSTTNSDQLLDNLRVDISALYDFKLSQTTIANIGLSIWNLLDKKNIINTFYRLNDDVVEEINQLSLGPHQI